MSKKQQSNRQKSAVSAQGIRRDADLPWGDVTDVLVEKGDIPAPRGRQPVRTRVTEQKPAPEERGYRKPVRTANQPKVDPRWEKLTKIQSPEPEPELVADLVNGILEMPEYVTIQQAVALEEQAKIDQGEVKRILGDDDLEMAKMRIKALNERIFNFKVKIKNAAIAAPGVTEVRNKLWGIQKFSAWLEEQAEKALSKSPAAQQMREELSDLMAKVEEAAKYQEDASKLLKEAGELLASIK